MNDSDLKLIREVLHELSVKGPLGIQPPYMGEQWSFQNINSALGDVSNDELVKDLENMIVFRRDQKARDAEKYGNPTKE